MPMIQNRFRLGVSVCAVALSVGLVSGCKSPDAERQAGTVDPSFYKTPEGAVAQSRNARYRFHLTLMDFSLQSGMLADEFHYMPLTEGIGTYSDYTVLDSRYLPDETHARTVIARAYSDIGNGFAVSGNSSNNLYEVLQLVRNSAAVARQALRAYAPTSPLALQGEMAAYEAFMMVMLADLYCSGIPLSTLPLENDFVYEPGSVTQQVYERAIAVFDSAITLAGSDASIRHLASIGKGRALLALGQYAEAATSVQDVPTGYVFDLPVLLRSVDASGTISTTNWSDFFSNRLNVSTQEGSNGLNFRTAGDPRVDSLVMVIGSAIPNGRRPKQPARLNVATYIEAQLIRAEALAQAGDAQYLTVLNDLRANATNMAPLAPLTEPTVDPEETVLNARVDLILRERAFWLFFTGHRQGDLRRLIRHYSRTISTTYPTGFHPTGPGYYSEYVDIPIPISEIPNPHFTGCVARGA